jgi:aspartate/methionine/tyrosine aminotransferase
MSAEAINKDIHAASPATEALLSSLGRAAVYPPDIPFQAAQARGKRFNATIGQITDGSGSVLALSAVKRALAGLGEGALDESVLYSPVEGRPELRDSWREHHRPVRSQVAASRPLVTVGLTGALALVADLFVGAETPVLVPAPFWGNYRQIFGLRRGGDVQPVEVFDDGRWSPTRLVEARAALPEGTPAVVVLNLPSNPVGYSPTIDERREAMQAFTQMADHGPLLVICDDAYAGLVHEDVPAESMFWSLADLHPSLVPVKVDGATKELVLFGARVEGQVSAAGDRRLTRGAVSESGAGGLAGSRDSE